MAEDWSQYARKQPSATDEWSQYARPADSLPPFKSPADSANNYVTETLSNIPGSAVNLAKNIGTAILHPIDTASGVTKAVAGTFQRMTPGYVTDKRQGYAPESRVAETALKDRYGSPQAIADTIRKDPVGVAADVSAVAGGVSGLARGAASAARSLPRVASTAGRVADAAATVSDATNPVNLVTKPLGWGARKLAEPFVKSALSLPGKTERYGATPAKAALEETSGFSPRTVKESAQAQLADLSKQLDGLTVAAEKSGNTVDFTPAREVIQKKIAEVKAANGLPDDFEPMLSQITKPKEGFAGVTEYPAGAHTPYQVPQGMGGNPLLPVVGKPPSKVVSAQQPPTKALAMKRQFGDDFTKFDAAIPLKDAVRKTGNQAYHEISSEFNAAVPGAKPINQRVQSLIPVRDAAARADETAGPIQTGINRATRPTGGLAAMLFGLHEAGVPGATAALVAQEALSNPAMKMVIARGLYGGGKGLKSPLTSRTLNAAGVAEKAQDNEEPPRFAKGGIAGLNGPEKVIVGDGGEPEAIIPVSKLMGDPIADQLQELTSLKRRVVKIPHGSFPHQPPKGMVTHTDMTGNRFVFNPSLISKNDIKMAIATNRLSHILGSPRPAAQTKAIHAHKGAL